jgi:dihydroorotase
MPERVPKVESPVSTILVKGGTVVDENGERRSDVLVSGGMVKAVGESLDAPRGATVLDAGGCIVAPGLVDLHTHLREPGAEDAECVETGARAASLGGFTAVTAMPNTDPPIDNAAVATEVLALGAAATCRVGVAGAITVGRAGERLAPMAELASLGVRIFTDDGVGVQDASVMRRALEYAKGLRANGMPVVLAQHCEERALSQGSVMNEGAWSSRLGLPGSPAAAEELMVARDIALCALTSGRVHFLHLSTEGSVELVKAAKARGLDVTAEVTPHHLFLTDDELASYDPVFKVNPPLRTASDLMALRDACASGVLDAIATDHAPHSHEAKDQPLEDAAPGMIGLETALSVALGALCFDEPATEGRDERAGGPGGGLGSSRHGSSSVRDVLGLLSWRPARIAGLSLSQGGDQGGPVVEGAPGNLCVVDPSETWAVEPERFASRSRNSPFRGHKLTGRVRHTIYRGEAVVVDGEARR